MQRSRDTGSIHRNTFINAPTLLDSGLRLKAKGNIFFAGQISGVEGYVESAAMGLLAGIQAARTLSGLAIVIPPGKWHSALWCTT